MHASRESISLMDALLPRVFAFHLRENLSTSSTVSCGRPYPSCSRGILLTSFKKFCGLQFSLESEERIGTFFSLAEPSEMKLSRQQFEILHFKSELFPQLGETAERSWSMDLSWQKDGPERTL